MRTAANNAHIDFVPFQADGQAMADYIKRYGLEADWQGWLTKAGERVAYKIPAKDGRDFQVVWVDPAKREMVLNPTTRAAKVEAAGTKGSASFTLTCYGVGDDSQNTMAGAYLAQDGFREFVIDYLKNLVSNAKFWKYDEDNTDPAGADGYMRIESVVMDYDNLTIEADFSAKIQGTATYEYATNSEFGNDEVRSAVWYALVHAIEDKVPGGDITMDKNPVNAKRIEKTAEGWLAQARKMMAKAENNSVLSQYALRNDIGFTLGFVFEDIEKQTGFGMPSQDKKAIEEVRRIKKAAGIMTAEELVPYIEQKYGVKILNKSERWKNGWRALTKERIERKVKDEKTRRAIYDELGTIWKATNDLADKTTNELLGKKPQEEQAESATVEEKEPVASVNPHMDTAAVRVTAALQITKPGEGYSQEAIQSAIAGLKWEDYPADGKLPYTEGYAINAVRKEFNLPRPSKLALNGTIQPMNDKEGQHALYGINIPYKNADLILYIADTGTETFVVAKDEQWKGKDNEPATTAGKVEFLEVGDTVRFSYPGHSFEGKVGEIVDSDFKRTGVGIETVYQVEGEGIDPEDADSWATADELERVTAQKTTAATDSDWTFQHNAGSLTGATHKSGIEIKRVKTPSRKSRRGMEMGGVRWEVEMPNGTIYSTHSLESAQEYVEKTNRLTAQRTTASMQEMEVTGYQIRRGDQIAEKDGALWTVESVTIIGKQVRVVVRGDFLSARGEKTVSLRGDKKYKIVRDVKESDAVGTYEIDSKTGEHRKVGASVSAVATIRKEDDGYHVRSKDGKNLGGPYKTEEEAKDRLKQVETFKHKKAATAKAKPDDGPTDETYAVYGDSEFYRTGDHFYFSNEGRLVELTDDQADQLRAFLAKNTDVFKTEKAKVDALRKILIEDLGLIKRKMIELEMIAVKAKLQESHGDKVADLTRKVLSLARAVKSAYVGPTAVAIHPIADQIGVKARQVYNETHTDNWVTAAIDPMSRDPHSIRAKIDEIERDVRDLKLPLGLANVMANRLKDGLRELKKAIDNL